MSATELAGSACLRTLVVSAGTNFVSAGTPSCLRTLCVCGHSVSADTSCLRTLCVYGHPVSSDTPCLRTLCVYGHPGVFGHSVSADTPFKDTSCLRTLGKARLRVDGESS